MPHFATRQHDSLRAATGRRHHLNLLLHDYNEENTRVYGNRAPGLLTGSKFRGHGVQAIPASLQAADSSFSHSYEMPSLTGQALALSGAFPQLQTAHSDAASGSPASLTTTAMPFSSNNVHQSLRQAPSWLTAQQRKDRQSGMKVAKLISSHRSPIGAFANFDMTVAP